MTDTEIYGPNTAAVAALIDRIKIMTSEEIDSASAAWDAARGAYWCAALALVVRDLITTEQFKILADPLASVIGSEFFEDEKVDAVLAESPKSEFVAVSVTQEQFDSALSEVHYLVGVPLKAFAARVFLRELGIKVGFDD